VIKSNEKVYTNQEILQMLNSNDPLGKHLLNDMVQESFKNQTLSEQYE